MRFHRKCGDRVTLLNENSTAIRNFVEFNHGLIFSGEPLKDDVIFEVCIDRKVNVWNGSLEIGVTTLDPEFMELPATATKLRNSAWIMSGSAVLKDGVTLINSYGPELDSLQEGDCLGVMRTGKGELMFYINGRCLGVAARDLPNKLFSVIDLYGQCVQVSIMHTQTMRPILESSLDQIEEDPNNDDTLTSSEIEVTSLPGDCYTKDRHNMHVPVTSDGAGAMVTQDRLRFHPRCGILVKLSANNKTAERARPLDDYNNGVVMTHRPLYDNEMFEIRIDRLVDKWSGSIEVGVTTHNPATIRFPSTMTNVDSGTIMMSGCKVLLNGHGTCMEYGNFNLDELREGDTVGMMRKSNKLHYFINGIDQGVATDKVEQLVWGVIDLYGMTVKVSIVDPCEYVDSNINNLPPIISNLPIPESRFRPRIDEDSLLFHTLRDSNVIIINDGKTAHRPNAFEFFNNGTIMTNRPLRTNELFQVRLDLVIPKWAGSIEIGVTQQSHSDIQFSFKMSNAKGTWAMTGEDVIRDGAIIIPQYVRNLNRLAEGDTVGVMRKNMGILHFYVNGVDQGPAAFNIPENVYGIIDLYGRVAQATIVDSYNLPPVFSPESPLSSESNATVYPEMCFHRIYGRNARLSRNRLTASRATVYSEFNDAVLFSSRPLRECDMFELRIDKMVDCWIGSLEIGVTAIRPDDLEANGGVGAIAGTATDLNWDTYILSGSAMMKDGECVRSGYPLDLDTLTVGSRIGMMWHSDRSLHYYLDGMDMGKAWYVPHLNIYAVVDLYGQCTQVTILQNEERAFNYNGCTNSDNSVLSNSRALISPPPPYWSFSEYCGDNICLVHDYSIARRLTADPAGALVFSSTHLAVGEMFEIKIVECKNSFAGSFRIGVTDINILNAHVNRSLPPSVAYLPHFTAYIDGKYIKYSRSGTREHDIGSFVPSLDWLRPGDMVGLKKTNNGRVLVYYNSELLEVAFEKVPDKVYVVMEIYGHITKIQAISRSNNNSGPITQPAVTNDNAESHQNDAVTYEGVEMAEEINQMESELNFKMTNLLSVDAHPNTAFESQKRRQLPYTFHFVHGNNIKLCSSDTVAVRTCGYKDGIAIVSQSIKRGQNFRFRVDKVWDSWQGGMSIGAVGALLNEPLPQCATHLGSPAWVLSSDVVNDNGTCFQTKDHIANALEGLSEQSVLTIQFRLNSDLVIHIDGKVVGVIGSVPRIYAHVFPLVDLYGKVSQVSVLLHPYIVTGGASLDLPIISENLTEESLAELDLLEDEFPKDAEKSCKTPVKTKYRTYSHENLVDNMSNSVIVQPGPSHEPSSLTVDNELRNNEYTLHNNQHRTALHHSLILSSNGYPNRSTLLTRSHSTHNFRSVMADNTIKVNKNATFVNTNRICPDTGDNVVTSNDRFCDTNIQHNHRYREADEVDNQYNVFINELIQQRHSHNMPCFPERNSDSQDRPTDFETLCAEHANYFEQEYEGNDNFNNEREANVHLRDNNTDGQEKSCIENANYFKSLLHVDPRTTDDQSFEAEWEASGERCEHLHFALKYWNSLVQQHPELGHVLSRGQVRCFCNNCSGGVVTRVTGWVRIERADAPSTSRRAFWQVDRGILQAAQSSEATTSVKRPKMLQTDFPSSLLYQLVDKWDDEEGKPQHMMLVVEVDTDETHPENDRLLAFLIYVKAHGLWRFPMSNSSSEDDDE